MKHSFTKYLKNANQSALFPQKNQSIFILLFVMLWVLMVKIAAAKMYILISMYVPPVLSSVSKANIIVKIALPSTFSAEEKITITGLLGDFSAIRKIKAGNIPTTHSRKNRPDFDTSRFIVSPQVVAFAARIKNPNLLLKNG